MIIEEFLNEGKLVKHYSDKNVMLLQNETGVKYSDPVDVVPCRYTYTETDEPIDGEEDGLSDEEFRKMIEEAL